MTRRCGQIALVGRPNVGKSTLVNALVGDKVAVVSRRPQTTRNRILGIVVDGESQLLLVDTPGLHRAKGRQLINTMMNRAATAAAADADLLLFLVDATRGLGAGDEVVLRQLLATSGAPIMLVATKIDVLRKPQLESALSEIACRVAELREEPALAAQAARLMEPLPVAVSAKRPDCVKALRQRLAALLPEGPWLFPEDDLTDMPRQFLCGELVREQVFRQLGDEIPYGCAVKVDGIEFKPDIVVVRAALVVERASHKPIVLGKGGTQIRAIGKDARLSLERHFGQRVYLDLVVRVAEGWTSDARLLGELAHMLEEPTLTGPG